MNIVFNLGQVYNFWPLRRCAEIYKFLDGLIDI